MQQPNPHLFFDNQKELEKSFHISLNDNNLPILFSPCKIDFCLVCVCLSGQAETEVDLLSYHLAPNDILVVFPGQILACKEKSSDFTLSYFTFSNPMIEEIMFRFPTAFIEFIKENVWYPLPEAEKEMMFAEYFTVLHNKYCDTHNVCRSEIILNLLHNFYLDLYSKVLAKNEIHSRQRKHKKELLEKFLQLVKTNPGNREVAFYAGKLCITPKYVSMITKESTGSSAKELIDKFAITELRLLLRTTSTALKEIVTQLNYPSEAYLCKYFKKHTGITPSHYRNSEK
jgi:AraC-like DNA-binding protein